MEDTPELPRHSGPLDLLRGAAFPLRAAPLVLRVPRLRRLALLCAGLTLGIFLLWGWALWSFLPGLLERLWHHPTGPVGFLWELTLVVSGALAWLIGAATLPLLVLAPLEDTWSQPPSRRWAHRPPPRLASSALPVRQSPPSRAPRSG
jgi:hypothetical protein